jgi:hypothetical protein
LLCEQVDRVTEHGCDAAAVAIGVDEGCAFDAIVALPFDRKASVGFFDVERFRVALAGEPECQVVITIDDPGIAGFAGEQLEIKFADQPGDGQPRIALDWSDRRSIATSAWRIVTEATAVAADSYRRSH